MHPESDYLSRIEATRALLHGAGGIAGVKSSTEKLGLDADAWGNPRHALPWSRKDRYAAIASIADDLDPTTPGELQALEKVFLDLQQKKTKASKRWRPLLEDAITKWSVKREILAIDLYGSGMEDTELARQYASVRDAAQASGRHYTTRFRDINTLLDGIEGSNREPASYFDLDPLKETLHGLENNTYLQKKVEHARAGDERLSAFLGEYEGTVQRIRTYLKAREPLPEEALIPEPESMLDRGLASITKMRESTRRRQELWDATPRTRRLKRSYDIGIGILGLGAAACFTIALTLPDYNSGPRPKNRMPLPSTPPRIEQGHTERFCPGEGYMSPLAITNDPACRQDLSHEIDAYRVDSAHGAHPVAGYSSTTPTPLDAK